MAPSLCFLCFAKVCLSHRLQAGTERGLGALQHSLWPDVCSICLAIWMKALWVLCESMNFHPDKHFFQVAGAGDCFWNLNVGFNPGFEKKNETWTGHVSWTGGWSSGNRSKRKLKHFLGLVCKLQPFTMDKILFECLIHPDICMTIEKETCLEQKLYNKENFDHRFQFAYTVRVPL